MFFGQAGTFLSFQARRSSAKRSSTSDLTVGADIHKWIQNDDRQKKKKKKLTETKYGPAKSLITPVDVQMPMCPIIGMIHLKNAKAEKDRFDTVHANTQQIQFCLCLFFFAKEKEGSKTKKRTKEEEIEKGGRRYVWDAESFFQNLFMLTNFKFMYLHSSYVYGLLYHHLQLTMNWWSVPLHYHWPWAAKAWVLWEWCRALWLRYH